MGYGNAEEAVRAMYQSSGAMDEFNKLKPSLSGKQMQLVVAFNRLSCERKLEQGAPLQIKDRDIHYYQQHNGSHGYAPDLFVHAIRSIDAEYITQRCEEMRRKMKNRG